MLRKSPHKEFLERVRDYLPMEATIRRVEGCNDPESYCTLSELCQNRYYHFNGEAFLAMSHAIEDLALDEGTGSLLSTFPEYDQVLLHKERYWQLGATLEEVQVITCSANRRLGRVKFIRASNPISKQYRAILFQGKTSQAMLIGKPLLSGAEGENPLFVGFFTFNPRIIQRLWENLLALGRSRDPELVEFERLYRIDVAARQMCQTFAREQQALERLMRRLQVDGQQFPSSNYTAHLDRCFARLDQWKNRLCLLADADERRAQK